MSLRQTFAAPLHPALVKHAEERAAYVQNRAADTVTRFAGSMTFVYVHIVWFALWVGIGVEAYPFGLLTMVVSLEAIFLSTFVMISQNRADEKRQVLADHQWEMIQMEKTQNDEMLELVQLERKQNEDILDLSRQILSLTSEVRTLTTKVHLLVDAPRA
jgi:uncharacterized membrane protein